MTLPRALIRSTAAAAALGCALPLAALAPEAQEARDDPPITFVLEDASSRDVLELLASLKKLELRLDPAVTGSVTVELRAVPLSMALDEVCAQADCEWEIEGGDPAALVVRSTGGGARISLDVDGRTLREAVVEIESESGLTLWLAPSLDQELPVTLKAKDQPVAVVLDELSSQIGARWSARGGTLAVYPDVRQSPADHGAQRVPNPATVGLRVSAAAGDLWPPTGMTMSWSRPVVTWPLDAEGRLELVLSWLPLGADSARLLPLVVACDGEAPWLVHRGRLIDPAAGESELFRIGGLTVEIASEPPPSWREERPPAAPAVCGATRAGELQIRLGEEGQPWATERRLPELPGRFWMVTTGAGSHESPLGRNAGALVYLGRALRDRAVRRLLLVSGGPDAGPVSERPVEVAAGSTSSVPLDPAGGRGPAFVLRVKSID